MKVLAFDLATKTGIAFGRVGGKPSTASVYLGKNDAERWAKAISYCASMIESVSPDLVIVESAVGGAKASAFLIGLVACVTGEATRRGVPVKSYFPATVRKHFLGKALTARDFPSKSTTAARAAVKAAVVNKCRQLGWDVQDDNAADAAALWDFACSQVSLDHQMKTMTGLFTAENRNG
jgi:hypothetical protein